MTSKELSDAAQFCKSTLPAHCHFIISEISGAQSPLIPSEIQHFSDLEGARLHEVIAGRTLARMLIPEISLSMPPILSDVNGVPLWPKDVVGSITHKGNVCGVLIASSEFCKSVGLDLEIAEPLARPIWETFTTAEEVGQGEALGLHSENFANILFSCKEAAFKCFYPLLGALTPPLNSLEIRVLVKNNQYVTKCEYANLCCVGSVHPADRFVLSWALIAN